MIHLLSLIVPHIIVIGDIAGFFTNLLGDLTPFALAAGSFYFAWAAFSYMRAGENETREIAQAKHRMYAALGGIALIMMANTIAHLFFSAASGQ